jgi:hypothetical protein
MPRFIVLYRAPRDVAARFATATPEEVRAGAQLWTQWFGRLGFRTFASATRPPGDLRALSRQRMPQFVDLGILLSLWQQ